MERGRGLLLAAFGAAFIFATGGCKRENPQQHFQAPAAGGGQEATAEATGKASEGKSAGAVQSSKKTAAAVSRVPSRCPVNRKVTSARKDDPAGVIFKAYEAALKGESGEEQFLELFASGVNKGHVERLIWPKVQEYVLKYVASKEDPSFVVCRQEELSEGRVKIYVKCKDKRKSDPPIIVVKEGDEWKIDVMTP